MTTTALISSQSIGTSTNKGEGLFPQKLTLNPATTKFVITAELTNGTGSYNQAQRVVLRYATSSYSYTAANAVAQLAAGAGTRFLELIPAKSTGAISNRFSQIEVPAGQYLYLWVDVPTTSVAQTLSVDCTELSSTASPSFSVSASFTRPNDTNAYTALDVESDSTSSPTVLTFANIGPVGGKILLTRVTHEIDVSAIPSGMGAFRIHLYNASPTAINDNAAFDLPSGDRTKYLGFIEIPTPYDLGSTLWADTEAMFQPIRMEITLVTGTIYGILQTVAGYTPTAQAVKKITLHSIAL